MCTVSWRAAGRAYDVFFNRDELHTRGPEIPPRSSRAEGRTFLAPRDSDHGGTWLIVNDAGVTLCLLNDYGASWHPEAPPPRVSRGHVLLACAAATTLAEVHSCLRRQELARTLAFHVFGIAPGAAPLLWHWRGDRLDARAAPSDPAAFSSSSFSTETVVAARLGRLGRHASDPARPTAAELAAYHHFYDTAAGAFSVLMRRPDAATRSICHAHVDRAGAFLEYERVIWPADCAAAPRLELTSTTLSLQAGEYSGAAGGLMAENRP